MHNKHLLRVLNFIEATTDLSLYIYINLNSGYVKPILINTEIGTMRVWMGFIDY